jgi:hypothetical protein
MDPDELGSYERYFLKIEAGRFLENSNCPLFSESFLKIPRHLVNLLAMSVSRFQEKGKKGEMITKNDNIK